MYQTSQQLNMIARQDLADATERMGTPTTKQLLERGTLAALLSINHHLAEISKALGERAKWDSVL